MRKLVGMLSLVPMVYLSGAAFAADSVESSVREYVLSRMTSSGDDWLKEDLGELNDRTKELKARPKNSDLRDLKDKIALQKAQQKLLIELKSDLKKIDPKVVQEAVQKAVENQKVLTEWTSKIDASQRNLAEAKSEKEKAIAAAGNKDVDVLKKEMAAATVGADKIAIEEKIHAIMVANEKIETVNKQIESYKKSRSTIEESNIHAIAGTPFKIKTEVVSGADGKKSSVKMSLALDTAADRLTKLPKEVKDRMNNDEMARLFEDKGGKDLFVKNYKDDADLAAAIKKDSFAKDAAADMSDAAKGNMTAAIDEIGNTSKPGSGLGNLQEELNKASGLGNSDELRDIEAKKKVAEFIKRNPKAREMDPCDLLLAATSWSSLSAKSRQECSDKDPKKAQQDKAVAEKNNAETRKADEQAQAARAKELAELQQHCEGLYRQKAMSDATAQVTQPINALMDALTMKYSSSEMYAALCAPATTEGADEFDQQAALNPNAETARLARRIVTDPDTTRLQKERDAVSLIMRRAIYSLEKSGNTMGGALAANAQTGLLDMNQMQLADAKVKRMADIYNCAKGILNSLDAAVDQRRNEINGQLGGGGTAASGTSATGAGTVSVNATATGGSTTDRRRNSNQRPATQRANQLLRSGTTPQNSAPKPNYMGN